MVFTDNFSIFASVAVSGAADAFLCAGRQPDFRKSYGRFPDNFFEMKRFAFALFAAVAFLAAVPSAVSAQEQQEPPTVEELAAKEAERLESLLDLEYWQVFYVDSTLQYNFQAMKDELEALQKSKVSNTSLYIAVQDKWMEKIDSTYMRIFNEEQWKSYLKSGAAKQQKARAKRKAKSEESVSPKR